MTNEQAIKIATVVWGWEYTESGKGYYRPYTTEPFPEILIPEEVQSWQGFGRTVEGMLYRGAVFQSCWNDETEELDIWFYGYEEYLRTCDGTKYQLIESTHLAALEACEKGGAGE